MILQLVLSATLTFTTVSGRKNTPIDMAFDSLSHIATFQKSGTGALTVKRRPHNKPQQGWINEKVYPQKGWVYYPDVRKPEYRNRTFFYYPDVPLISWHRVREGNRDIWPGNPAPCFDAAGKGYSKGQSYKDDNNKNCVCGQDGFVCVCEGNCPDECPEGMIYMAAGPNPAPTCLERNPKAEGTVRGCFCTAGTFLQDGKCVDANECLCLYEGEFFNVGDTIDKEGECQTCECQAAGEMSCEKMSCPVLACAADEIKAQEDDECCPFCSSDWVKAINPVVQVKEGLSITLQCEVDARGGVLKKNIKWFKGKQELTSGISKDRLTFKLKSAEADDGGQYTCKASKGDKSAEAHFKVTVNTPQIPGPTITPKKSTVKCVPGKRKCQVKFKVEAENKVRRRDVKICKLVKGKLKKCKKARGKRGTFSRRFGKVKKSVTGEYVAVVTYNGKDYQSPESSTVRVA